MSITVCALYHFVDLPNYADFQEPLSSLCAQQGVFGTLLLASEGINGTVAGPAEGIQALLAYFKSQKVFADVGYKLSYDDKNPFYRLKVRLKKEIVTMGDPTVNGAKNSGIYVGPEAWNELISDPDVLVLDTRNTYEVSIGTFKGAVNPKTTNFREFPDFVKTQCNPEKHKKVAMFCTGGIRCEKASAYMKQQGFDEVYHLKGGILKYLEDVPTDKSTWEGECFVFDGRVSVGHDLEPGSYDQCYGCRHPITAADKQSVHYEKGISCHHCYDAQTPEHKSRVAMRQKQIDLAKKRGDSHVGMIPV
jgi:UPF0176 protein